MIDLLRRFLKRRAVSSKSATSVAQESTTHSTSVQRPPDKKVPCRKCGNMILERMAVLKNGYCIECSGSAKSVFAPENFVSATFPEKAQTQSSHREELKWTYGMKDGDRVKFCGVSHVGGVVLEHTGTVLEVRPDDYCVVRWDPGGVPERIMGGPSFVELVHGSYLHKM